MSNQTNLSSKATGVPDWSLGWRLKRALAWGGVSVQEMADHLDYSRGQISRYLNDKGEPPRRPILRSWALRCGVPFQWLAYGDTSENGPDDPGEQGIATSTWIPDNVRNLRYTSSTPLESAA